jgi:hypothetical protein
MTFTPAPASISTTPPTDKILVPPETPPADAASPAGGDSPDTPDSPTDETKKAAKKKKLTKKERNRLRKEKEEQERLEQERLAREEQDMRERAREQKKREEQQQRLQDEGKYIQTLRAQRIDDGKRLRAIQAQTADWEIFTLCNHSIDVRSSADVNTFITAWKGQEEAELPELFEHIHQADTILEQLNRIYQAAEVAQDPASVERCRAQSAEIRCIFLQKLEAITMRHLVFSDKYAGAKNEVQVSSQSDGISFSLWVNLSKNPRVKDIEFPGMKIEISKAIAMSSLAIRVLMMPAKPFNEKYLLLDRLIKCELLQLPTPPKRIGTMTLRQSPHLNSLVTLSYPLKSAQAAQPPLNFKFGLEPGFLTPYMQGATVVELLADDRVTTEHISKVSVDADHNEVFFSSSCIGTFALAIPRYSHFPLKFWELRSLSETCIEIYVHTQLVELTLVIDGNGKVSMEAPFVFEDLTPVAAVEFLAERGLNIIAPPGAVAGITAKNADLELVLAQGISDTVSGFHVKWSKWNAVVPADRALVLMKPQVSFEVEEEDDEETPESPPSAEGAEGEAPRPAPAPAQPKKATNEMIAILAKANHMVRIPNSENEDDCNLKALDENQIHQHLFPMFLEHSPPEVQQRVKKAPTFLCDATFYFLKVLRLFSMSQ